MCVVELIAYHQSKEHPLGLVSFNYRILQSKVGPDICTNVTVLLYQIAI